MKTSDLNKLKRHLNIHPHIDIDWETLGRPYCWIEGIEYEDARAYIDLGYGCIALFEGDRLTTTRQDICIGRDFIAYYDDNRLKLFKKVVG